MASGNTRHLIGCLLFLFSKPKEDDILAKKAKYHGLSSEYAEFSKVMGLPQERQRVNISPFKGVDVSFGDSGGAAMSRSHKYSGTLWQKDGVKISEEEYSSLLSYANDKGVKLVSFENFDGDPSLVRDFIDGISTVAKDFPKLSTGKTRIQLHNSYLLDDNTFAKTIGNKIFINNYAYRNKELLSEEYAKLEKEKWFVSGTDYRSIPFHEMGHAVANVYGISSMNVAKKSN